MSTIAGCGGDLLASNARTRTSAARQIQNDPPDNRGASFSSASADATANAATAAGTSSAPPLLSSSVLGTLIADQVEQTRGPATSAASGANSAPLTPQQISDRFDVHNLTHGQAQGLVGDLVKSGVISPQKAISTLLGTLGLLKLQQPEPNGQIRILNSDGTDSGDENQPFDAIQQFQNVEAFDASHGLAQNASDDQTALNMLNSLDRLRSQGGKIQL